MTLKALSFIVRQKLLLLFQKSFWGTSVLLWGHWYPWFGFLVKCAVGFKARMDPLKKQFRVTYKGQVRFTQISACNEPTSSVTMY